MVSFRVLLSKPWWDLVFRVVVAMSFVMAVTVYYQQHDLYQRQERFIKCIASYNDAQSEANEARSQAFQDSLSAMDNVVHSVATATTREQVRKALDAYEAAREEADVKRQENPLPVPPKERCN